MHGELQARSMKVMPRRRPAGAGRGFCAGQDLNDRAVAPGEAVDLGETVEAAEPADPPWHHAAAGHRPVNGVAAGRRAPIFALACDIVVAAKSAKFIQSFSASGLIPDSGGSWHLPRLVGQARALGLALTGEPLPAEKAADWGLIWKAVDDDALDAEVDALAAKLASLPPLGLAAIKADHPHHRQRTLDEELDLQRDEMRALGLHRRLSRRRRRLPREAAARTSKAADQAATSSANFFEVDVAARDDADDRPLARLAAERGGKRKARRRPSAITRALSAISRIASRTWSSVTMIAPSTTACIRSHMRSRDALAAGAVDERRLPVGEFASAAPSRSE